MKGQCECGAVRLEIDAPPAVRFFCHCTTCQQLYRAPFADITVLWSRRVRVIEGANQLDYRHYNWLPVSINRGICRSCRRPVIGHSTIPPMGVSFLPAYVWGDQDVLPAPLGHLFYHRRVAEIDDGLPKVEGLIASELSATAWLLPRLLRPR